MNTENLKFRRCSYTFCTIPKIRSLGSAPLKLPFDINIVLVQTRYHGKMKPRNCGNLHCMPYMAIHDAGNLRPRRGLNPFCTNTWIIFLSSASLKLPSNMNIALVQTGTMAKGSLEI